jgi:hypothetical protein
MNRYRHVSKSPITITVFASLQLSLISCSSTELSSPPPFIPYAPGDAAKVDRAVGNIRASQYGAFVPSISISPLPYSIGYPAILTIKNQTDCKLGFYFKGPSRRLFGVAAGRSERLSIAEGRYEFAIDTRQCTGKIPPLYGEDIFTAGHIYTFSLSEENTGVGYFDVNNNTGDAVTVTIGGRSYKVDQARQSIALPQGNYMATVTARCGTTAEKLEVKQGSHYRGTYWCESHELSAPSPEEIEK